MATEVAHLAPSGSSLPLYRLDVDTYHRLVEAGALEGLDVELHDGLLVNKHAHREDAIHRLDVGTYERMVASGALDGQPIELLQGLLIEVSPQGSDHAAVVRRLTHHLAAARAVLGVQLPLETRWGELPEPDLVLTEEEPPRGYHPRAALLAVEVAVTSHKQDRETKADMYAWAPVSTYWLVDVPAKTVEVYSDPGRDGYSRCDIYPVGTEVPSPAPGVDNLDVGELLEDVSG
ncbi:MAG: Uma2 family endonuclease [Solirubrobacteraceae bacterium]|jgi:Uma2 family endonuclease